MRGDNVSRGVVDEGVAKKICVGEKRGVRSEGVSCIRMTFRRGDL
jgi:hypothetical protein